MNTFLTDGGDGFTQLRQGTGGVTTSVDLDAFVAHLQANPGVTPPATDRIAVG